MFDEGIGNQIDSVFKPPFDPLFGRIVTMTAPVVLGTGKRMFGDGTPPRSLELVEHRPTPDGIAMATYDVKGAVEIADFQFPEPAGAEIARRARITAGKAGSRLTNFPTAIVGE